MEMGWGFIWEKCGRTITFFINRHYRCLKNEDLGRSLDFYRRVEHVFAGLRIVRISKCFKVGSSNGIHPKGEMITKIAPP